MAARLLTGVGSFRENIMPCNEQLDICVKRGDTEDLTLVWTDAAGNPVDLTGATVRMDIKSAIDIEPPIVSLSTGNGITLDAPNGEILIELTSDQTKLLEDVGVYDVEITEANGDVSTILQGTVQLDKDVTV